MQSIQKIHTVRFARSGAAIAVILPLAACGLEGGRPQAGFAPPAPIEMPVSDTKPNAGAIFQANGSYAGLHQGNRARAVGDLVTIVLTESITTSKNTSASTKRDGSASITPPTAGPLDFLNPDALKAGAGGSFKGSGGATQNSTLNGVLSVTIAAVNVGGTAKVVGEKQMSLSQGEEWVQFAGTIRLADISADNRIASSQVANARVIYTGRGAIQTASRPGWLSRFFNAVSPF